MSRRKRIWLASLWLMAFCIHNSVAKPASAQDADDLVFHDDYNEALREARAAKKPIFLEFRCAP